MSPGRDRGCCADRGGHPAHPPGLRDRRRQGRHHRPPRSGIADLARHYSGHAHAMPDAIYDALWNGAANTADPVYLRGEWADHQRLHQYSGNVLQTYGGDSIDLDQDYLDVDLPAPGGTSQATSAVTLPNDMVEVFYRGTDNSLWRGTYSPRTGWSAPVDMGGTLTSPPSAVCTGPNGAHGFYRGAGGDLWQGCPPARARVFGSGERGRAAAPAPLGGLPWPEGSRRLLRGRGRVLVAGRLPA